MTRFALTLAFLLASAPAAWAQTPDPLDEIINRPRATPRPTATPTPEPTATPTPAPTATPKSARFLRREKLGDERTKSRKLPGLLDVRFGDSQATVVKKLSKRFKRTANDDDGSPTFNGVFAGYRNCYVFTRFKAGKLVDIWVNVFSQDGDNAVDLFKALSGSLLDKYGLAEYWGAYKNGPTRANQDPEIIELDFADAEKEVLNGRAWMAANFEFSDHNEIDIRTVRYEGDVYLRLRYAHKSALTAAPSRTRDF